jgi:8-oxo-dGTP pyrophosphatase MutT (NUDIX family)
MIAERFQEPFCVTVQPHLSDAAGARAMIDRPPLIPPMIVLRHGLALPPTSACVLLALECALHDARGGIGAADGLVHLRESRTPRGPLVELSRHEPTAPGAADDEHLAADDEANDDATLLACTSLPIGHQQAVGAPCSCPACADDAALIGVAMPPLAALKLAAVAVAIDPQGRVLLTRRPPSMRTFPGAWVLPGGAVDATDASVYAAAVRELHEETGLRPAAHARARCIGVWESCYPTTKEAWARARSLGERTAHHLVVFVEVCVDGGARVELQADECDAAVWIHPAELCDPAAAQRRAAAPLARAFACAHGSTDARAIDAARLLSVYPNALGEGVGRGHMWAIHKLFESSPRSASAVGEGADEQHT